MERTRWHTPQFMAAIPPRDAFRLISLNLNHGVPIPLWGNPTLRQPEPTRNELGDLRRSHTAAAGPLSSTQCAEDLQPGDHKRVEDSRAFVRRRWPHDCPLTSACLTWHQCFGRRMLRAATTPPLGQQAASSRFLDCRMSAVCSSSGERKRTLVLLCVVGGSGCVNVAWSSERSNDHHTAVKYCNPTRLSCMALVHLNTPVY